MKYSPNMDFIQHTTLNHLKRFVRSLDKRLLEVFNRLCTGSDILGEEMNTDSTK